MSGEPSIDALMEAVILGDDRAVGHWLRARRMGRSRQWHGAALHAAVQAGHVRVARRLLQWGISPDCPDPLTGKRPLARAIETLRMDVLHVLLSAGANPNMPCDGGGFTALHVAVDRSDALIAYDHETYRKTLALLVRRGADPAAVDAAGRTPLDLAIELDGGRFGWRGEHLYEAVRRAGRARQITLRTSHRFLLGIVGAFPDPPAAVLGAALSAPGVDVNAASPHAPYCGDRPLHRAAASGNVRAVRLLLAAGADPALRGRYGATALHMAALSRRPDVVALLLRDDRVRALCNARDDDGCTPLHYAVAPECKRLNMRLHGYIDVKADEVMVIARLVAAGAEVDVGDDHGDTPLHYAIQFGHGWGAEALIRNGASQDAPNKDGVTPRNLSERLYGDLSSPGEAA